MGDFGAFTRAQAKGPSAHTFPEIDMQCDSVCATDGMPVAAVAGGFPAVAGGLHDVLALAQLRLVGTGHARTASTRACESGAQARSDPCNHRQPVSQDSAKGGQRGYDGGKKTKGRKRHLAVDTVGWPLAVAVHSAGISETRGAHLVLIRLFLILPQLLKILVDGGYKQSIIDWGKAMFGYLIEVVKRPHLQTFKVLPKRWIVERTFGWFNWQRRLSKDYEHNPKTSEAMLHFISCSIMLRRLTTL
jgi:transposase